MSPEEGKMDVQGAVEAAKKTALIQEQDSLFLRDASLGFTLMDSVGSIGLKYEKMHREQCKDKDKTNSHPANNENLWLEQHKLLKGEFCNVEGCQPQLSKITFTKCDFVKCETRWETLNDGMNLWDDLKIQKEFQKAFSKLASIKIRYNNQKCNDCSEEDDERLMSNKCHTGTKELVHGDIEKEIQTSSSPHAKIVVHPPAGE